MAGLTPLVGTATSEGVPVYFAGEDGFFYTTLIDVVEEDVVFCIFQNPALICFEAVDVVEGKFLRLQPVQGTPLEDS